MKIFNLKFLIAGLAVSLFTNAFANKCLFPGYRVDWSDCNQSNMNLSKDYLVEAKLLKTIFSGADLHQANLSDADVEGANFDRANLDGANLSGAKNMDKDLSVGKTMVKFSYSQCLFNKISTFNSATDSSPFTI